MSTSDKLKWSELKWSLSVTFHFQSQVTASLHHCTALHCRAGHPSDQTHTSADFTENVDSSNVLIEITHYTYDSNYFFFSQSRPSIPRSSVTDEPELTTLSQRWSKQLSLHTPEAVPVKAHHSGITLSLPLCGSESAGVSVWLTL